MSATTASLENLRQSGGRQKLAAVVVALGMIAIVGSALAFQHIGGYIPCKLCLEQRTPYYLGIPFVLLAIPSAFLNWPACLTRGLLAIGFVCLCATAALGFYHAGVEWSWWPGPTDCGATADAAPTVAADLLNQLSKAKPPACNEAAGRFLGLSFAGWNVVAAAILAVVAFKGAFGEAKQAGKLPYGSSGVSQ